MKPAHEQLPSGKEIIRNYSDTGELTREQHTYDLVKIGFAQDFRDGKKVDENYFVNNRMVTRKRYEKERLKYPDMPEADSGIEDGWAPVLQAVKRENSRHRQELLQHKPDFAKGQALDGFCLGLIAEGESLAATALLQHKQSTLGELSHVASKRLLTKLLNLECKSITACKVDHYDDGMMNTGHLVIELPIDSTQRQKLLHYLHKLAQKQGYSGDFDDGQRYAYVKLD